jgi:uncharacterized Zn finger protein (UPF0148 family)
MAKVTDDIKTEGKLPVYAWPGGYPLYYITKKGEVLCPNCANETPEEVDEYEVNWEDTNIFCDGCDKQIERAYNNPEEED